MTTIFNNIKPIFVLVISYLLLRMNSFLFSGQLQATIMQLLVIAVYFALGLMLHRTKKKNQDWIKKVIISFIVLLIVLVRFDVITITWLSLSVFINANPLLVNGFMVYLGWLFFE